jgi:carbonic anhydrase/acetyltransferase-like protein (isoleucine patch superfamily)
VTEHPLGPGPFFHFEGDAHRDLFPPDRPVWEVLNALGEKIEARFQPNAHAIPRPSGVVERTTVLWEEEVLLDGFTVTEWAATKGRLRVERGGKVLPGASVISAGAVLMDDRIEIGPGALVEAGALIRGPTRIGPGSEVRQGAYIRGSAWVGEGCVVGHATEVKNAVFLDGAKAGHFAYVGDSVLGFGVNLGAGTKLANLKIVAGNIRLRGPEGWIDTGRRKLGAILGDAAETGCNAVTSPGALLGPKTLVYPNMTVPPGIHLGKRLFRVRLPRGES